MNTEAIKTEIESIISEVSQPAHKQYPASKTQQQTLRALGILELVPARRAGKLGYTDAAAVIEAATTGKRQVGGFNADGEGDVVTVSGSQLYKLLNS